MNEVTEYWKKPKTHIFWFPENKLHTHGTDNCHNILKADNSFAVRVDSMMSVI